MRLLSQLFPSPPQTREESLFRIEQVRLLYGGMPFTVPANAASALIIALLLANVTNHLLLLIWLGTILLTLLGRWVLYTRYRNNPTAIDQSALIWLIWFRVAIIANGIAWGASSPLLFPAHNPIYQLFLVLIVIGVCAGAITALATDRISAGGFVISAVLPLVAVLIGYGDPVLIATAVASSLFLVFILNSAARTGRQLREVVQLRTVAAANTETILRQQRLSDALTHAQAQFIVETDRHNIFRDVHNDLLKITGSEYGFIGEVLYDHDEQPFLKLFTLTDIAWDEATRALYQRTAQEGMEFHNLDSLIGAALVSERPVFANDPANDARSRGLPPGHPPLHNYLGIPIHRGDRLVAVVGLANRRGDYDEELVEFLDPLTSTIGQLVEAARNRETQQENEENYRMLFEFSNDANLVFDGEQITHCNQAAVDMFGYRGKEELLGKHPTELSPPLQPDGSDSATAANEIIGTAFTQGHQLFDWVHLRADGSYFSAEVKLSPMRLRGRDVIFAVVRDISSRKKVEQEIRRQRDLAQRYLDTVQTVMVNLDQFGKVVMINRKGCELLGYEESELLGQPWFEKCLPQPDGMGRVYPVFRQIVAGNIAAAEYFENPVRCRDGSERLIAWHNAYFTDAAGDIVGTLSSGEDITERKAAERQLIDAREEAERANRAKSDFLSSMSHELRTPLNAILGFGQLLQYEDNLNADQQDNVAEIVKAGDHLLALINEVLDLAKVESGRINLSLEPVEIDPVIEECVGLVRTQADQHDISLRYSVSGGLLVSADRTRLKQVLLNLLSNAVKYNFSGGKVNVDVQTFSDRLRIAVIDSGKGIAPARVDELFQPFNRLDAEGSEVEGTGIGLTLTKRLVELMGGEIDVRSEVGVGTTFTIELPLEGHTPDAEFVVEEGTIQPVAATLGNQHTILYIEDNPANLKLVAQIIGRHHHIHLLTAHAPETGIAIAADRRPNLILLDINMPGMDGYEVLDRLRADPTLKGIPVVAITANALEGDRSRGIAAGFDDYLTKPLNVGLFIETIDRFLTDENN